MSAHEVSPYLIAFGIGVLSGAADLIGRFRIDFDKAKDFVAAQILGAMQSLSDAEQAELKKELDNIAAYPGNPQARANLLGYLIINYTGEKMLTTIFTQEQREVFKREA